LKGLYDNQEQIDAAAKRMMKKRAVVDLGVARGAVNPNAPVDP